MRMILFFFSSRRRHTRFKCDWSSDVCSSDLGDDGLTVDLDRRRKNGGKGVAGMVFVAGQGLADGGADGGALGNGDEGGWLRRLAGSYFAGNWLGRWGLV